MWIKITNCKIVTPCDKNPVVVNESKDITIYVSDSIVEENGLDSILRWLKQKPQAYCTEGNNVIVTDDSKLVEVDKYIHT